MLQHVRVGTRASALALTQTGHVVDALAPSAAATSPSRPSASAPTATG